VAGFYAAMIETDHAQDKTFNKNFFDDFKIVLKKNPPVRWRRFLNAHSSYPRDLAARWHEDH
jgi:DNA topoisomerase I